MTINEDAAREAIFRVMNLSIHAAMGGKAPSRPILKSITDHIVSALKALPEEGATREQKAFVNGALYWNKDHQGKELDSIFEDIVEESKRRYPTPPEAKEEA